MRASLRTSEGGSPLAAAAGLLGLGAGPCPCCLPVPFDPPPGLDALTKRPPRRWLQPRRCPPPSPLGSAACSSTAAAHSFDERDVAVGADGKRGSARRNIVANGLARLEDSDAVRPEQPDWEELSPRVLCVLGQNPSPFTLNGTNCYLVGTGPRRLLIDTGDANAGAEEFMECLRDCMVKNGIEGLDGIVITHIHIDHIGNIGPLQKAYGPVPVYVKEGGRKNGNRKLIAQLEERGLLSHLLDEQTGEPKFSPFKAAGANPSPLLPQGLDLAWVKPFVDRFPGHDTAGKLMHLFWYAWQFHSLVENLRTGVYDWRPLLDGQVFRTEGATLRVLHTPGHAEEHTAFLLEEEHAIFAGDHVLGWGTTLVVDLRDYMESLRRMLALRPTRLYPGHGVFIEDGQAVLRRYISHRETREAQAWEALQRRTDPVAVEELVKELYPDIEAEKQWMAIDNVEKILRKFVADGAVGVWEADETLVPVNLPNSYDTRRLKRDLRWATKSSVARSGSLAFLGTSKL